jgi:hypothetical protein
LTFLHPTQTNQPNTLTIVDVCEIRGKKKKKKNFDASPIYLWLREMSRHAQFNNSMRQNDYDDDYDDELSSSYGSVGGSYTQSPTTAGYLFNRSNGEKC